MRWESPLMWRLGSLLDSPWRLRGVGEREREEDEEVGEGEGMVRLMRHTCALDTARMRRSINL
jgi:hypothetical protein